MSALVVKFLVLNLLASVDAISLYDRKFKKRD